MLLTHMVTHSSVTEQNQRVKVDPDRHPLLFALRDHSNRPQVKRVQKILELLIAAETNLAEWRSLADSISVKSSDDLTAEQRKVEACKSAYFEALGELANRIDRYRWRSTILGDFDGFREAFESNYDLEGWAYWEYEVVRILLNMIKQPGALSLFRRCKECSQWFEAATNHQRFCSDSCRKQHASRSPEFREKRRIYMRETYRPREKRSQQKSLEAIKGTTQKKRKG
jgi:hypothetical protein